jgi:hypothetical protein
MSNKINIFGIVIRHFSTLRNVGSDKLSISDISTFYIFPLFVSIIFIYFSIDLSKDLVNIIVTAGSIFTGLLLNLLILVYDQKSKLGKIDSDKSDWKIIQTRHNILRETYFNIAYSTILSLLLVFISILQIIFFSSKIGIPIFDIVNFDISMCIISPVIIFIGMNLVLTLLMIIKRIFMLLTTET